MAQVTFLRGLKEFYSSERYPGAIYFSTDTKEIIVDGVEYGLDLNNPDLDLITLVEFITPDTIKFRATNGNETIITLPPATSKSNGLMSSADKEAFDKIPEVYATKEEVSQALIGVYSFKGVVDTLNDLPSENLKPGDVYKIREAFELDGRPYSKGTHVVWNGTKWNAMEGEEPGYSKSEADDKFVAWARELVTNNKVVLLPKGSKLIGTMLKEDGQEDGVSMAQVGIYEDGAVQQMEVGSSKLHLNLNSSDRPTVELPDKSKETLAYIKDLSWIDTNN